MNEVAEKADSGATEPYFCRLSDDQLYVVKGRAALARGLLAEVICAELGQELGLPIPPMAVAKLDGSLLEFNAAARASLGEGYVFASRFKENLVQSTRESLNDKDADVLRRLFLFDCWVKNGDRTGTVFGGNPNLFFDPSDRSLVAIDHNLAFDESFDIDNLRTLHISRDFWFGRGGLHIDRALLEADMERAVRRIADIEDRIPDPWLEAEPRFLEMVELTLSARTTSEFWDAIG